MSQLAQKECGPCTGDIPPLKGEELVQLEVQLGGDWETVGEHQLEKTYKFKNFVDALAFTNKVGEVAEAAQHHPDIYLTWGKVKITLWTHKIDGLSENDFILAAKMDQI